MFPRRHKPDPEHQALVERVVDAAIRHGQTTPDVAIAYVSLSPLERELDGADRERAQELVERIAEDWRRAELAGATEATVIEDLGAGDAVHLLSAIQDSLILGLSRRNNHGAVPMLSIDEATDRTQALATRKQPVQRPQPDDAPRDDVLRFDELETRILETVGEAALAFPRMAPDASDLSDAQAADCREHLVSLAACGRELDQERDLVASLIERRDLRPSLAMLHSMVQALVLRLSEDPERRARAAPLTDLAGRYQLLLQDWKTWYAEAPERKIRLSPMQRPPPAA